MTDGTSLLEFNDDPPSIQPPHVIELSESDSQWTTPTRCMAIMIDLMCIDSPTEPLISTDVYVHRVHAVC